MEYKDFITNKYQDISFTVIDVVVKKLGNNFKPLLCVSNLFSKGNEETLSSPIYINYSANLIKYGEIKPGDSLKMRVKLSGTNKFGEIDYLFTINSILDLSLVKYDKSKRSLLPRDKQLLVGKIMSDNKENYFDQDNFETLVTNYQHWSKFAKKSNDRIIDDGLSLTEKHTFIAKVKGKIRSRRDSSVVKGDKLSLTLIKELRMGTKVKAIAIVNYTKALRSIGRLHVGDKIQFDAYISQKELRKNNVNKYKLKNISKVNIIEKSERI